MTFKLKTHILECKTKPEAVHPSVGRTVQVANRCLGKGTIEDKVTLGKASGLVFSAKAGGEEEEAMELGEIDEKVRNDVKKYE